MIHAGAHRTVFAHARAHRGDVVGPWHAEKRGVVHQQLAVRAEDEDQSDVAAAMAPRSSAVRS